jgi:hypothetical protein
MKALLEFELPESCNKCRLFHFDNIGWQCAGMDAKNITRYYRIFFNNPEKCFTKRAPFCPLKIIKET